MKGKLKMTKKRRIISTFLAACMVTSSMIGMSVPASADPVGSTYSIVIPSTLTVANSGWNSIGNISVSGTLEDGKKLNITATSLNNFALKSGDNSVTYTIKNASTDTEATTSWDFTKEQLAASAGATQAIGIDVSDYSEKPAGTYTDTVTFTAKVETAGPTLADALKNGAILEVMCRSNTGFNMGGNFTYNDGVFTLNNKVGDSDGGDFSAMKANASVSGTTITINTGVTSNSRYDHTVTLNTSDNSYTLTGGDFKGSVTSVKVNGEEILNDLTNNDL